jgi:hypothetical protein
MPLNRKSKDFQRESKNKCHAKHKVTKFTSLRWRQTNIFFERTCMHDDESPGCRHKSWQGWLEDLVGHQKQSVIGQIGA